MAIIYSKSSTEGSDPSETNPKGRKGPRESVFSR